MSDVYIIGVGQTRFTRQSERGQQDMAEEAVTLALKDAGVQIADIEAVFSAAARQRGGNGQRCMKDMGLNGTPIVNVENACASGPTAAREAYAWIRAGLCDIALAFGTETLSSMGKGPLELPKGQWMFDAGLTLPTWYAMQASRHMAEHGLKKEELASVSVKSRKLSQHNPFAHFRKEVSLEEVLASPLIADPLTLMQCCPKTDGSAAAVLVSEKAMRRIGAQGRAVRIRATALGSGVPVFTDKPVMPTPRRVAIKALEMAGIGPEDLDVVEVHDAFTIGEILYTEALGLCAPGEGGQYAATGKSLPNSGYTAVNTSGGLLSRGHPLGASGLAQIGEIVTQLRGEAGARQCDGARIGAVHTMGANEFELDANVCSVFVLEGA